jgi:uncharacterized protein YPO0396
MTLPLDLPVPATGQWRLAEVQLANWGTFDGKIYRLPIARRGHLVTGPSGSGKSSLLDAIAAVLTPDKWLRLNQAAQGSGARADQRSLVSYVRGAWSRTVDDDEDRVVSQFLRTGATWSGILLRLESGTTQPVTLARLFFLRAGGSSNADINDVCVLERSAIDLRDVEPFVRKGVEVRKLQAAWPDAVVTSNRSHARFYARLRSVVGIADETALQLLHKTQSAKNLDSLDDLFRDYMLEEPSTFALADNAVAQFGELRSAHDRVVQLRLQRDHLLRLRDAASAHDEARVAAEKAKDLASHVVGYQHARTLLLATNEAEALRERLVVLREDVATARLRDTSSDEALRRAERLALELGGAEVEHVQRAIDTAEQAARDTEERWQTLARQLAAAGIQSPPRTAGEFAELRRAIEEMIDDTEPETASYEQLQRLFETRAERDRLTDDIASLRRTGSTVPPRLLAVRTALSAHLGLPDTALPFAAELIEVAPRHVAWTGAIERVLRPLSLAMLVRSEHLRPVRRWVEEHQLDGLRLVFEEVRPDAAPPRPARSDVSLLHRVVIADGPFAGWLGGQLSERFDYACVDSPDHLDRHDKAVTIGGQVKTSRTRYEKDDRMRIGDRRGWVLGDREAKIEALVERLIGAEAELAAAQEVAADVERRRAASIERRGVLKTVREQRWAAVDVEGAQSRVAELQHQLEDLTSADSELSTAVQTVAARRSERQASAEVLRAAELAVAQAESEQRRLGEEIDRLNASSREEGALDPEVVTELDGRFRARRRHLDRVGIAAVGQQVVQDLRDDSDAETRRANTAAEAIVREATSFNEQWPAAAVAADLTPSVDDRGGYLDVLDQIVANGLPQHEASFLRLLRERSRDMVADLVNDILAAPREIAERIGPVNDSLRRSPFDTDRFLGLKVKTRHTDTVTRFIADLRAVASLGWTEDDLEAAEERFAVLSRIMEQLASSLPADRAWRRQCLDTRQHVTFRAEEIDPNGHVHATYDSGAAMSGGQQQKLVVFCLAAALRYQLADADDVVPRYGTIVLDEAFDKADTRYTRMALDVIVEFGFQLILATPQKLLQTIEPYVGAVTSIENPTRKLSQVSSVVWDDEVPS